MSDPTNNTSNSVTITDNNANNNAPQNCTVPPEVQNGLDSIAAGVKTLNESLPRMEESLAAKPEVVAVVIHELDGQIKTLQAMKSSYSSISRTSEPVVSVQLLPRRPGSR